MKNFFTHNFNTFVKLPPLEHIFNSQGKIKILVELTKNEDLTITSLGKKVKLNHSNLKGHLNKLCDLNIVIEKRYGRIRIFQ
ncbi:MAG: ArsR family transcriptional regulator, partial [Candidatus Heimdallarchaeota archaeon]|nr:ArsR family transcriptional regulator [Candidatus Heimdallarchaeota archaeon]